MPEPQTSDPRDPLCANERTARTAAQQFEGRPTNGHQPPTPRRALASGALIVVLMLLLGAGTAPAARAGSGPAPCTTLADAGGLYQICLDNPSVFVVEDSAFPGGQITVQLAGWRADSTVALAIESGGVVVDLGSVTVSNAGAGEVQVVVPGGVPPGPASVVATGRDVYDLPAVRSAPFIVLASGTAPATQPAGPTGPSGAAGAGAQLPVTGRTSAPVALAGVVLVMLGALLVSATRRRITRTRANR